MAQPSIQVLISLYKPNLEYLKLQLESIDNQAYENLEILIHDDCPECPCSLDFISSCITRHSFKLLPYCDKNLGYAKAFERLINESSAQIVFFSDQDDIWLPGKVNKCLDAFEEDKSLIVVTDRAVIDGDGVVVTPSVCISSTTPSETWSTGDDIAKFDLFETYALGMSMALDGDFARSAMPVSVYTGHDKWLMACGATEGIVSHIKEPLVQYRRHGKNVSGILKKVKTKADYYRLRPENQYHIIEDFLVKYPNFKDKEEVLAFANARRNKSLSGLFKYRYLCPKVAWFEIVLCFIPAPCFPLFLSLVRRF